MKARSLSQLASIRRKAYRLIRLEQLWSELRCPLLVLALWMGASLLHIPQFLPDSLHALLEGGLLIGMLWMVHRRIHRLPPPTAREIDARIEADSALQFQPLSTLTDTPATGSQTDEHHQLIWAHHQSRALNASQELRVRWPRLFPTHRSKITAICLFLALGSAFYTSMPHTLSRVRAGLLPGTDDDRTPLPTLQAWVDSPSYAPAAPLFLTSSQQPNAAPLAAGAMLHVVVTNSSGPPSLHGTPVQHIRRLSSQSWQLDAPLQHSGRITLHVRGRTLARWSFTVTPDHAPILSWTGKPAALRNSWQTRFPWKAEQSHGIASLDVILSRAPHHHLMTEHDRVVHIPLPLDGTPTRAEDHTELDLSDDPFAGLSVQGALHARSLSGLESTSSTVTFTLGARSFKDPLARALITLRQHLALGTEDTFDAQRDLSLLSTLSLPRDLSVPLTTMTASFKERPNLSTLQEQLWFLALYAEDRAQSGIIMASSMADLRAAQQDTQHQITYMGQSSSNASSLEQQQELHQRLNRVQEGLNHHMQLMVQKANQSGIVMPLPNGKRAPWTKLAKRIEKDVVHHKTARASAQLRQMIAMAEQIRQADTNDMQSLSQQMAARAEAHAQKSALSDLIKRETELLNQTQARLAVIHQRVNAMQQNHDVSQMSTSDLLRQLGMSSDTNTPAPSEDEAQLDEKTRQKHAIDRQNNHATQHALRALDHVLTHRGKALTGKDNPGFTKAATDMGTVLHELAQRHDDAAAIAERKVLEDLSQARDEMKKNQKSSQKNQQGRLGFIPPPQPNQGQNNDQSDGQDGDSQSMGSAQQDQDRDLDANDTDDEDDSDGTQQDQDTNDAHKKTQDPLGRKTPNGPESDAHIPDHDHDRARAIERELQRRAADRTRPQHELDYLNRLLAPFRDTH